MDNHPIEISNIVIGLIILISGFMLARPASRMISFRLATFTHAEKSVTDAFEKISYYILLVGMVLMTLDIINVPLTAFKFVGGALAIGVGFGSQNIIGNFISGLILIIERPIRVGDVVEINNNIGRIVNIGARCTHIRTGNSIDMLVPNSSMLESKVINWTFTDTIIRVILTLGVAYESDTRQVEATILDAIKQIAYILTTPMPQVYFTSFGDSTLNFEVLFWVDLSVVADRRQVISELNHMINRMFNERHIKFPAPQREVHVMGGELPISVKVME